jgi:flagellin-like protein
MKKKAFIHRDEEGVSPVIATILMVAITVVLAAVLYIMVMNLGDPISPAPIGKWDTPKIISSTEVNVGWAKISADTRPMELEIVLVLNLSSEGTYTFTSDDDGVLTVTDGNDVGTLTYADLANNGKVNTGDAIKMTNLTPGTDYKLIMLWKQEGDQMDFATFTTPGL